MNSNEQQPYTPEPREWEEEFKETYEKEWYATRNGHSCVGRTSLRDRLITVIASIEDAAVEREFEKGLELGFKNGKDIGYEEGRATCVKDFCKEEDGVKKERARIKKIAEEEQWTIQKGARNITASEKALFDAHNDVMVRILTALSQEE